MGLTMDCLKKWKIELAGIGSVFIMKFIIKNDFHHRH